MEGLIEEDEVECQNLLACTCRLYRRVEIQLHDIV